MTILIRGYDIDCKSNKQEIVHLILNVDKKTATDVAWAELIRWQKLGVLGLRASVA